MQDIDIINLFIETSEEIFNSKMQLYCKEDNVYLVKIENQNTHKKINLNTNTLKKISIIFENNLKDTNKMIQINSAKKCFVPISFYFYLNFMIPLGQDISNNRILTVLNNSCSGFSKNT